MTVAVRALLVVVSIHAPARGATSACDPFVDCTVCFNPRAREGRDFFQILTALSALRFQSTRPRGARLADELGDAMGTPFQSTRPRGARRLTMTRLEI